eukprot:Opistho-2@50463
MLIQKESFRQAYEQMRQNAMGSSCSILILVAPDADALCACKILTTQLKMDMVTYQLMPVTGYGHIRDVLTGEDKFKSVVLLNCGANVDLTAYLSDVPEDTTFYVSDSHRPYDLGNVYGTVVDDELVDKVILFDDGTTEDVPDVEAYRTALEDSEDEFDNYDEEEEEASEGSDDDHGGRPPKRRRLEDRMERRKARKDARKRLRLYKEGSSYGASCACLMYTLVRELSKETNDLLWHAVVGLTDQYIHERIDRQRYGVDVNDMKDEVLRKNVADDEGIESTSDALRIKFDQEFRFMLFRHWSLFDGMMHSSYVANTLGIWNEKGRKKLHSLFAMIGAPLAECHQNYRSMDIRLRRELPEKIATFGPDYGLKDLTFGSFFAQKGLKHKISASDVAYALTALLESSGDLTEEDSGDSDIAVDRRRSRNNSYKAMDALSSLGSPELHEGLQWAMEQHRAIVRQVSSMMAKKNIVMPGPFRYAYITEATDLHHFKHPLTLAKLAYFLNDAIMEASKNKQRPKPLVVAALNEAANCYLVVGIMGNGRHGETRKNKFGEFFRHSADLTNARIKHDGFDSSVLMIRREDVGTFMESLHASLGLDEL